MENNTFLKSRHLSRLSNYYSAIFSNKWLIPLLLTLFAGGCKKTTEEPGIVGVCPVVVSTDPLANAVNVALDKVISATFNTDMKPGTIESTSFTIKLGSTLIQGKVAPTATGTTFTFTPTASLLPFVKYTGTITTDATDQFGTAMISDYVWNFTTIPRVTLSSNPVAGGTTTGAGVFAQDAVVTVSATPAKGYTFTNWTDSGTENIASASPNYQFTMAGNRALVANFSSVPANTYVLTVLINPLPGGTVAKNPNQAAYNSGTPVRLMAMANPGYTFTSWSGDATGNTNPLTVIMNANKNITANFTLSTSGVSIGTAANFGAFGGSAGITNQGLNTIINNGAIATTGASTVVTGFHDGMTADIYTETPLNVGNATGGIFTAPPAPGDNASFSIAQKALADANLAYLSISPASRPGGTDPGAGELGGLTLAPGVYKSASGTFKITNGDLTLDAQGNPNAEWIFQTAAGLTVGIAGPAGARSVIMINGGAPKNVYWYVGSAATINAAGGGVMSGTIIASSGVTFSTAGNAVQTVLNGRAISLIASVTMVNTTINNQ